MISRRNFLVNTGIATSAILLAPSFAFGFQKQIGLQLYTLRDDLPKDVKGVIEKIAKAGYNEVETYGFSSKTGFWGLTASEFGNLLTDNGLYSPSGHFGLGSYLADGDTKELHASIEAAKTLRSKYVTIPWMEAKELKNLDACKRTAEKMNEAGRLCKDAGLKLAYHNHSFEFDKIGNTNGYEILLKETDKKLVHFEMDLYWVVRSGNDPIKLFKEHPGRFSMWHVKDMDKVKKEWNTEVGNGSIDFKAIFAQAKLSGMKHFFVEQESNYVPNPLESIKTSSDFIKANLV